MRAFKPSYTNKQGVKHRVQKWYVEVRDSFGRPRRVPCGVDKSAALEIGRKIERLVAHKVAGEQPSTELMQWLEGVPKHIRKSLARISLLDGVRFAAGKPLSEHITDWHKSLLAKGTSKFQANQQMRRATAVIKGTGARYWNHLTAEKVEQYLKERRDGGLSIQTSNHYLGAVKALCNWMVENERASRSPLARLEGMNAKLDRRRERRALTPEEMRDLIVATISGDPYERINGVERSLVYRVGLQTGLRSKEIRQLKRGDFDLKTNPPMIRLKANQAKNQKDTVIFLRPDLANDLKPHLAHKHPTAKAFRMPDKPAKMLAHDLKAAKIDRVDESGRVVDFHALRHTFITTLARNGVHPSTAQRLSRHSTIALTMNRYTHVAAEAEISALSTLPDLSMSALGLKATGTDGMLRAGNRTLASSLPSEDGNQGNPGAVSAQIVTQQRTTPNTVESQQNAISKGIWRERMGVEPTRDFRLSTVLKTEGATGPSSAPAMNGSPC